MKHQAFILPLFLVFIYSCKPAVDEPVLDNTENHRATLTNFADNLIIPSYENFETALSDFETSLQKDPQDISELRAKSDSLYFVWQRCAFYDFGPALLQSLQNNINIYPVDTADIKTNIDDEITDIVPSSFADQKGLPTIDYLVYANDSLSTPETTYLQLVVDEMQDRITSVKDTWVNSYRNTFVENTGTDNGSGLSTMLNAYIRYYERDLRDGKLGFPLGVRNFDEQLPLTAEAYYSDISHKLLIENISSMKAAFYGNDKFGIDDLLTANHANLLATIKTQWGKIEAKTNDINTPIEEYVLTNQSNGNEAYDEIQELLITLKIDLMRDLDMKISYVDTDGD